MEKDEIFQRVLVKIMVFLAYKQRTRKEISTRLERYLKSQKNLDGETAEDIYNKVIKYLEQNKLINDQEFIKLFVESKSGGKKAFGKRTIENRLIAKGISRSDAKQYLDSAIKEEDELKAAIGLLEKKFNYPPKNVKNDNKNQLGRFLLSRGFSYLVSRQAVDYLLKRS